MAQKTPLYEAVETASIGFMLYVMAAMFFPAYTAYGIAAMLFSGWEISTMLLKYDKFEKLLGTLGIEANKKYPRLKEKIKTDYGWCYRMSVPPGISTKDFEKHQLEIEQFFGHNVKISYADHNIFIEIYEIELEHLVPYIPYKSKGIEFPIGIEYGGRLITVDLSKGDPHMVVAGESGSGKSTILRTIITSLVLNNVIIHLIDLKYGAEFAIFRNSKFVKSFSKTKAEANATLYALINEVERRYNLFYENDCVDIKEYNRKHREKIPTEFLIVDEFADLQNEKDSIELLEELSAKARACGIHLIIATQRPDAKILNGRIKANCPCILGLKTTNEVNSRIIIDHGGLENLRGFGHGILKNGSEKEVQCYFLEADTARQLIAHTNIDKRKKEEPEKEIENYDFMKEL